VRVRSFMERIERGKTYRSRGAHIVLNAAMRSRRQLRVNTG
jgi:hypothetical protein